MKRRWLAILFLVLCFVRTAAACPPQITSAEILSGLLVGCNTMIVLPAFVIVSAVLCDTRYRKSLLWICWVILCAMLLGGAAAALIA